jgi:GH15 family glucan-1,4-alpha-glucosidase
VRLEDLGLIGNCQYSALVHRDGSVVWCCLPRFDSEPVFGALLDEERGGRFLVGPADGRLGEQRYLPNSNILETSFRGPDGSFRVLDFAPRFRLHDRHFRPTQLFRIIEPLEGTPRIRVRCAPQLGWSRRKPGHYQGSNHLRWEGFESPLRLTSDVPLSYLDGRAFTLIGPRHLALTWGPPIEEELVPLCRRFLGETLSYWQRWVKHCNIPPQYQAEVIRSALVLKLHCYEDTGAIVAAMTTSIPESAKSGRTWDYRYCWLRDAYYVLSAFRLLGHFEEREHFVQYLLDIVGTTPSLELAPLYGIDGRRDLDERVLTEWPGFNGDGPVRVGNAAALHRQHDVFGEAFLALAPIYFDDRFREERSTGTLDILERLARKAIAVAGTPDAGIWEYRDKWHPQTFSSLMCWAAADRMARLSVRHRPACADEFAAAAVKLREQIVTHAWNGQVGAFGAAYGSYQIDAALLQIVPLRLLQFDDSRLASTVDAIRKDLTRDGWLHRYQHHDDIGVPAVAFMLCTYWLVEALALIGRRDEATALFESTLGALSPLGLLSEDYDPRQRALFGNFPQAYSHVGLIHAAFAASARWSEVM